MEFGGSWADEEVAVGVGGYGCGPITPFTPSCPGPGAPGPGPGPPGPVVYGVETLGVGGSFGVTWAADEDGRPEGVGGAPLDDGGGGAAGPREID